MESTQPNKMNVPNYSSLGDYEKSVKKSTNNNIEKLELECVMKQIKNSKSLVFL